MGATLGLAADITALAGGVSAALGSGGLAVASGGVLAPISAAIAGEGAVVAASAAAGTVVHTNKVIEAWNKLTEPPAGGSTAGLPRTKSGAVRLPANNGRWSDPKKPGNSDWHSDLPDINIPTKGEPVRYENGFPKFKKWAKGEVEIEGLTGRRSDFGKADEALAKRRGVPESEIKRWRLENDYSWHHVEDCRTMLLVPSSLNIAALHIGGASLIERGLCP